MSMPLARAWIRSCSATGEMVARPLASSLAFWDVSPVPGWSATLRHRSLKKPSLLAAAYSRIDADACHW